ncbi:hypothetical protein IW152_002947 [Coemansia sp. BCRC 34962]|nr:hypothetical protein IW152_002947 [Coemansia sp. BCRC 34962]
MIKGISLFVLALLSVAASVYAAPQPVATATAASQAGVELYQGLHLPPGLRSRQRAKMHRRDIPYGGYLTFGNYQAPTSVPMVGGGQACREAAAKEGGNRPKPLLGLIDVDLDLHL